MILTLDIGNTNIKAGVFNGPELVDYWRISTDRTKSSDEYGILLLNLFAHSKIDPAVDGIIMSSVVPTINFTIEHMCSNYFNQTPMQVVPGIKTGINLKYENPRELGSDRIVNAVAAYELYGGPCIFIDFGTATTFGVVSERGEFLGGAICPGIKLASEALTERTSRLPKIELGQARKRDRPQYRVQHAVGSGVRLYRAGDVSYRLHEARGWARLTLR